jgi:cellulase/cellobiase CelA1
MIFFISLQLYVEIQIGYCIVNNPYSNVWIVSSFIPDSLPGGIVCYF